MHNTVSTATEFQHMWDARVNFLMAGACVPFSFTFPSTRDIVERLVAEERTTGITGHMRKTGDGGNAMEQFRGMSFDELMETSFQFRFPDVTLLDRPGDFFAGFTEEVLNPWKCFLLDNGFTRDRCYALAPVSGSNTSTGYHMDRSNVLFWNVRGRKVFHGLSDPDRWVPLERATQSRKEQIMPENLKEYDVLSYEVCDDVLLWNHLLTPHWVDAPELTFGINFSHGGLRHNGRLCRYEQYFYDEAGENPNEKWYPETSSMAFGQTLVGRK